MSNKLPSKPQVDTAALRNLKTVADVQQWLINYTTAMDKYHRLLKDTIDNFGMGTADWDIREANTADVAAGKAETVGNLIIINKTTLKVKREYAPV